MKKNTDIKSAAKILSKHFLFCECSNEQLSAIERECSFAVFESGENIMSDSNAHRLYVLLSGSAAVYTKDENHELLLRTINEGDTLGVSNLFADEPFVSRVLALSKVNLLLIPADAVKRLILSDPNVAMKYILFLSGKIRFLNKRIAVLSAGSAERKLAAWLDSACPIDSSSFCIPISMSALATALGLGRASLYRAFDTLTAGGFIIREKSAVTFIDRQAMTAACVLH